MQNQWIRIVKIKVEVQYLSLFILLMKKHVARNTSSKEKTLN